MSAHFNSDQDATSFADEFLDRYLQLGFGVLGKREVDLLVFHLLRKHHPSFRSATNYDLANQLGVTDTRLRNLLRDSSLRFGRRPSRNEALRSIAEKLFQFGQSKALREDGYLVFELEDPVLYREVEQAARDLNYFTDTSFNRSLLRIPVHVFVQIMIPVFDGAEAQVSRILAAEEEKTEFAIASIMKEKELSERIEFWLGKHKEKLNVSEKVLSWLMSLGSGAAT